MAISDLPFIITKCLLLTIIIEVIFSLILGVKNKKDILNIILVNIITNPIAVLIPVILNIYIGILARNISLYTLEILIFIGEGLIYKKVLSYNKIDLLLFSFLINLSSFSLGLVIEFFGKI